MIKKFSILLILLATIVFWVPAEASTLVDQPGKNKSNGRSYDRGDRSRGVIGLLGQRRRSGKNKETFGYRNYGQYRRTQVGNRRYRMVRRTYYRDGNRLTRLVRVFY